MANVEEQKYDMDQQRIDELQNQYFRQKLATVDANRLKEAREFLGNKRRPSDEAVERDRRQATASNWRPQEDRRA